MLRGGKIYPVNWGEGVFKPVTPDKPKQDEKDKKKKK